MYKAGKYDYMEPQRIFREMDENVKDPKFLALFLETIGNHMLHAIARAEKAERLLRSHGHNNAHRPITFTLLEEMSLDAEIVKEMAISLKKVP